VRSTNLPTTSPHFSTGLVKKGAEGLSGAAVVTDMNMRLAAAHLDGAAVVICR